MSMDALRLAYVEKPCGYSMFHSEIVPVSGSWANKSCNLVFLNKHSRGGYFRAMEQTQKLLDDVEVSRELKVPCRDRTQVTM